MTAILAALLLAMSADINALLGEWTGESKCIGTRPACVDEQNVYVITPPHAGGAVFVTAYKIVNGQRIEMGASDFQYDDGAHSLFYEFTAGTTHGRWEFVVTITKMDGTLTLLPDRTIVRRASLTEEQGEHAVTIVTLPVRNRQA
jgi:hypothetical protein